METSYWLFGFGGEGGHRLLHKPFRTKRFAGIGRLSQAFCIRFRGGRIEHVLPGLTVPFAGLLPEGHVKQVAAVDSIELGRRAGAAKPLGRFCQTCTDGVQVSRKPPPARSNGHLVASQGF